MPILLQYVKSSFFSVVCLVMCIMPSHVYIVRKIKMPQMILKMVLNTGKKIGQIVRL